QKWERNTRGADPTAAGGLRPRSGTLEGLDIHFTWQSEFDGAILVTKQGNPDYGIKHVDRPQMMAGARIGPWRTT
ncbi:MAG TPA: hypothetical protein VLA37_00725, partial [Sphingomonadaceae bacterium]|nr:hypothetical protein [Sphingomonadaceae bacterium]